MEVNPESSTGDGNAKAGEASTSSNNMVNSVGATIISYGHYHELCLCKAGEVLRIQVKASCESWRKKYCIGPDIEIFHGVDLSESPYLDHTIVFSKAFMRATIKLPLSPMAVSFFNYTCRAPQQFTTTSFVDLAIFGCLNAPSEYGNDNLSLEQFLFYY